MRKLKGMGGSVLFNDTKIFRSARKTVKGSEKDTAMMAQQR